MLKRIEVKNFKSLKHIDFKCAGLNLLMGLNGAGKSSFVQLLEVMRVVANHGLKSADKIQVNEIGGKGRFADFRYCYAPDDADIDVDIEFKWRKQLRAIGLGRCTMSWSCLKHLRSINNSNDDAVVDDNVMRISRCLCDDGHGRVMALHPFVRDKIMRSEELHRYLAFVADNGGEAQIEELQPNDDVVFKYEELRQKLGELKERVLGEIKDQEDNVRDDLELLWKHAQKIDAFRGRPECIHRGGRIDKCADVMENLHFNSEGQDVIEFLDKFGNELVLYKDNPMRRGGGDAEESRLIDEVNNWMSAVSPGVNIDIKCVQCGEDEMLVENVGFGDGDESRSFKPQNVGFGISYTLPVVVALLTAQPEDIIIIENPEAHLHPKGQEQMGELLARAAKWGVQLFVETHSDHIVNGIRLAVKDGIVQPADVNIAFFERKEHDVPNDDGTAHQEIYSEVRNILVDKNGSLSEYPDGFLDEWNNQLMELI